MEKHFEKVAVEGESEKVEDDVETIEKIAEMISTSHKDVDENNPKTKKRLQILMSRNLALDSCDDSMASSSHNEKNIRSSEINANDSDQANKKLKTNEAKPLNSETSEDNLLEKSRFEEIEGKLKEMFAGVEDEQPVNTPPPNDEQQSTKKFITNIPSADNNKEPLNKSPLPTKAAQKATTSISGTENAKQLNMLLKDYKNLSIPKSVLYLKSIPPRRRLSIGINRELLNFSAKVNNEIDGKKSSNKNTKREKDITTLSHNSKGHVDVEQDVKNAAKIKTNNKNQKKCSKYKKEIFDIKCSSSSCKKKIVRKSETAGKEKPKKMARMQRLMSSENETEEKQIQTKDIETKNRAPFILVKNNGSIVVVNTVTTDDPNEKCTRSKKSNNYVFERKTVKGCYSSTLGNRYDADTTDSSWKCVFCQIGPHKKGLGDLFGPYVISSDCDEYRSTKDYLANTIYSKKSPPFLNNETTNSQTKNNSKLNGGHLINIYTSEMSQVSADCYEIWVHEECAVWAPNIFVVGSRLAGLEEATWISTRYECEYCLKHGALLCCLQRDCKAASHVPCARESNWLLDESKFWVYCSKHALNKFLNKN